MQGLNALRVHMSPGSCIAFAPLSLQYLSAAGLREGVEVNPADVYMLTPIVASAFGSTPEVKDMISSSISSRGSRKEAYKL